MSLRKGNCSILEEKHKWFRGTARVELQNLHLEGSQRCIDWKNVARLVRVFADVGCDRLTPEHHVPVLVSEQNLETALLDAGVPLAHMLEPFHPDPPRLRFPDEVRLICLHGQHRLLAADRFLPVKDKWWTIDIYTSGTVRSLSSRDLSNTISDLSASAQTQVREQCGNSQDYSDGEKFRHICYYRRIKDLISERRWASILSPFKQEALKAIQNDSLLSQALERLLPFPGIWNDFNFSLFHRVKSWRCREVLDTYLLVESANLVQEIVRYLEAIHTCWNEASGNDPRLRSSVDAITVEHLQRLIPKHSRRDQERIRALFAYGEVFPSILGELDRSSILQAILSLQHKVLSFRTLSEDSKYLIPIKNGIQSLVDLMQGESIEAGMRRIHSQIAQAVIQVSEDEFRPLQAAPCDVAWFGYLQLVLFCIRNFNNTRPAKSRRGPRRNAPGGRQRPLPALEEMRPTTPEICDRLVTLAHRLGFHSRHMNDASRQDGEEQTSTQAHSHETQDLKNRDLEGRGDETQAQTDNQPWHFESSVPAISTDFVTCTTEFSHRPTAFEKPPEFKNEVYAQLYLPTLLQLPNRPAKYIVTSFGELREVLCAFYGRNLGLQWERLQETVATPADESMFLPIACNQSEPPLDPHGALTHQTQGNPTLYRTQNFNYDQSWNVQGPQKTHCLQDPAEDYRDIIEDTYRILEGHRVTEPRLSWKPLNGLTNGNLISELQSLNRECIQRGEVAFWKLEERMYFTSEKDAQLIRRLAKRLKNKEIGGIIARQLFGVVINNRFKYCAPGSLPAPVGETDGEDFANIIFLLDAPSDIRCSTWNMVLDGHLFSQGSFLALSSDIVALPSAKRPRSLASSIYPDSQGEERVHQRRKL